MKRVPGGRWRRIVLGHVLAEHVQLVATLYDPWVGWGGVARERASCVRQQRACVNKHTSTQGQRAAPQAALSRLLRIGAGRHLVRTRN